jgi:flagellar basal-body rod modification protein FlgD
MISGISAAMPGAASSLLAPAARTASKDVGRDEFLKLLTTQMKYQNPLDPLKDAEFVAQLAQFSTLEGVQKLNTSFADMLLLQGLTQGAELIGKTITYERPGEALPSKGVVEGVKVEAGKLVLVVGNQNVELNQVRSVVANARTA